MGKWENDLARRLGSYKDLRKVKLAVGPEKIQFISLGHRHGNWSFCFLYLLSPLLDVRVDLWSGTRDLKL